MIGNEQVVQDKCVCAHFAIDYCILHDKIKVISATLIHETI